MHNAISALNFATMSHNRVRILRWLADSGCLTRDDLKERSEVSRTTLQRNLEALEDRGWLQHDTRAYTLTTKGDYITDNLLGFLQTVSVVNQFTPFLEYVSNDALDFELHLLQHVDLTVADEGNPYAPVSDHIMAMKQATHFRCVLPSVGLQPMEIARGCVDRGSDHEIIFGSTAADIVRDDPVYNGPLAALLDADNCTLLITDVKPRFYLGVTDKIVQIGVEDDDGKPHALIETDTPEIYAWAEDTYAMYKSRSEPFVANPASV